MFGFRAWIAFFERTQDLPGVFNIGKRKRSVHEKSAFFSAWKESLRKAFHSATWVVRWSFLIRLSSFSNLRVSNWMAWNAHFWRNASRNISSTPGWRQEEKSMIMNETCFGSHCFSIFNKKATSSSFSPVMRAPVRGTFRKESVASSNPGFFVRGRGHFFYVHRFKGSVQGKKAWEIRKECLLT